MLTPKTPLPEFPNKDGSFSQVFSNLWNYNLRIHEYLKEREETAKPLEGLQELGRIPEEAQPEVPSQYITLMEELYNLKYDYSSDGIKVVTRIDVVNLINRVFRDNAN